MELNRFAAYLAQGFNHIPVYRRILADLDTPLSAYLKLADAPYSYLFESVQGGEKWGRYSILGLPASTVIKIYGYLIEIEKNGEVVDRINTDDPLQWINDFQQEYKVPDLEELPRFNGGLVGYFGYETIGYIESKLANPDKADPPKTHRPAPDQLISAVLPPPP